jgi:glycosyltransferase involved in cell wall biosynthesis
MKDRPKRVAIIRNAYSFDYGGGEKFPVNLGVELKKHGFEPIIISRSPKLLSLAKSRGLTAIRGWWWSRQGWDGKYAITFPVYLIWQLFVTVWYLSIFIRHRIDVVHAQSRDDFVAATFAGRLLKKRVIWTDHADLKYVFKNANKWYINPVGALVKFVSKYTQEITLVSHSEKQLIGKELKKPLTNKYVVIHNGVIDEFKEAAPKPEDIVICSMTSRLVTAKGIGEAIEAFEELKDQKIKLIIYGDGPESEKFESLAKNNKQITFAGHANDVVKALSESDIFIHPSYHEGFSLSLIEAAMCQLPIIACNVGGNREIVKDGVNGILINAKSSHELAEAIKILARNKNLRLEMGKASREIYLKDFQSDRIVKEKFLPLYLA